MTQLVQYFDGSCTQKLFLEEAYRLGCTKEWEQEFSWDLARKNEIMKQVHNVTKQGTMYN